MMTRLTISVGGMHCEQCVRAIGDAVNGIPGVRGATVELHKATVEYDDEVTSKAAIFEKIRQAGDFQIDAFSAPEQLR